MNGKPYAICKHCNSALVHPRTNGSTKALSRHLQSTCARRKLTGGPLDRFTRTSQNADSDGKPTQDRVTELVLKFFIFGNIAFAQAGNVNLNELIRLIPLESGMPASCLSRKVIRQRLHEHGNTSMEELHELLATNDSKVSLALDCWSSRSNYGFMGIIPSHSLVAPIFAFRLQFQIEWALQ